MIGLYSLARGFETLWFFAYSQRQQKAVIEEEKRKARFRPIVYVCSPYVGDTEKNTANVRRYCRFVVDKGSIPLAPHLFFPQFNRGDYALQIYTSRRSIL